MLQTEVGHAADDKAEQVLVGEQRWRQDGRKHIEGRAALRIGHWGQVGELLNRTAPDLLPDPLVFLAYLVIRRVCRPLDADLAQIIETYLDGAVAPVQGRVERQAQAGNGGQFHELPGATGQRYEPVFGRRQRADQELTFGKVELE